MSSLFLFDSGHQKICLSSGQPSFTRMFHFRHCALLAPFGSSRSLCVCVCLCEYVRRPFDMCQWNVPKHGGGRLLGDLVRHLLPGDIIVLDLMSHSEGEPFRKKMLLRSGVLVSV